MHSDINSIADMENTGSLTNKLAFEATESTIFKNYLAHLPKVKLPTFDVGDEVLFKNPHVPYIKSGYHPKYSWCNHK